MNTYSIHVDFENKTVSIRPNANAAYELNRAKTLARQQAEHYGFQLLEEGEE